ncbi:MAG: ankyrin repeat domain-containing protein [Sphingobacteriia bacterium]|nr:ankyrin repeat domain-containing protein [Sphingobacteriia bacterium]
MSELSKDQNEQEASEWEEILFRELTNKHLYEKFRGTGVFIHPHYVLTNYHVIQNGFNYTARNYITPLPLQLIAFDEEHDLALLYSPIASENVVKFDYNCNNREDFKIGDSITIIGYPGTRGDNNTCHITNTIITNIDNDNSKNNLVYDKKDTQQGSSGSAIFNVHGNCIGIHWGGTDSNGLAIGNHHIFNFLNNLNIPYCLADENNLDNPSTLEKCVHNIYSIRLLHGNILNYENSFLKENDIYSLNEKGQTPLHVAVISGNYNAVRQLINENAKLNIQDKYGKSPFDYANQNKNVYPYIKEFIDLTIDNKTKELALIRLVCEAIINDYITIYNEEEVGFYSFIKAYPTSLIHSLHLVYKTKKFKEIAKYNEKIKKVLETIYNLNSKLTSLIEDKVFNEHQKKFLYALDAYLGDSFQEKNIFSKVEFLLQKGAYINGADYNDLTILHKAVQNGSEEIVKFLLKHEFIDVNIISEYDQTPILLCAIKKNQYNIAKLLLEAGADTESRTHEGCTALSIAIQRGYDDLIKLLISFNANIEKVNEEGLTPLLQAANQFNAAYTIEILLEAGANIEATDNNKMTPLHIAVCKGYIETIEILIKYNAKLDVLDIDNDTPLHISVMKNYLDISKLLLNKCNLVISKNKKGKTPLHIAASKGSNVIIKLLLENGADLNLIDNDNKNALDYAKEYENLEAINLLSDHIRIITQVSSDNNDDFFDYFSYLTLFLKADFIKIETDSFGDFIKVSEPSLMRFIHLIYNFCQIEKKSLLNYKKDSNELKIINLVSSLNDELLSKSGNSLEKIKFLVSRGADVNAADKFGETPLNYAIQNENYANVKWLLENGADVNLSRTDGVSPLLYAIVHKKLDIFNLLLEYNAKTEIGDKFLLYPLHYVIMSDLNDFLISLLKYDPDLNVRDLRGSTALHYTSSANNLEAVKILYKYSKDNNVSLNLNIGNYWDDTPLHYAAKLKCIEIYEYLLEIGADPYLKNRTGKIPADYLD